MAFELAKWLKEDMKFSDAEVAEMLPRFTPERLTQLERGYVAASDRDALTQAQTALAAKQTELTAASDRLNAELAEWASLEATDKTATQAMRDNLHKAEREVLRLNQAVTTLAEKAGVDPKTVIAEAAVVVKPELKVPAIDETKFVRADRFDPLIQFTVDLPAQLLYIAQQHQELTGKALDTRPIVAEIKRRGGQKGATAEQLDPIKVWEELHGIPALRQTRDDNTRAAEIKSAEDRGYERARTEAAVPGVHPAGKHAVVFQQRQNDGKFSQRTSVLKRPQPETSVRSAAAALASGKYRTKTA